MNKALVKDLARKRREYLRSVLRTRVEVFTGGSLSVIFGLTAILIASVWYMSKSISGPVALFLILGVSALICRRFFRLYNLGTKMIKSLPHVPPVAEQLAALPAEEILLRGSDQPTAAPEELLRAAHKATDTAAGELLRPKSASQERMLKQTEDRTA